MTKLVKIPWYFRPTYFWAYYALQLPLILLSPARQSNLDLTNIAISIIAIAYLAAFLSWPYLLYRYLAPYAERNSKHFVGRCDTLFLILLASYTTGITFNLFFFLPEANQVHSYTDILALPMFYALGKIHWRASDLLVELEGRENSKFPDPVMRTFVAYFFLPFLIVWFSRRLMQLKTQGKIQQ